MYNVCSGLYAKEFFLNYITTLSIQENIGHYFVKLIHMLLLNVAINMKFQDPLSADGLRDELETAKDNLDYVQDRIKSGQNDIMALMEIKAVSSDKYVRIYTYCRIYKPELKYSTNLMQHRNCVRVRVQSHASASSITRE